MSDWREDLLDIDSQVTNLEGLEIKTSLWRTREIRKLLERVKELESYFGRVGYPSDWEEMQTAVQDALELCEDCLIPQRLEEERELLDRLRLLTGRST